MTMMKRQTVSPKTHSIAMVFALGCVLSGVANGGDRITEVLEAIGKKCTAEHGYDWQNPGEVEEYELGVGEKAWRECVYAGIRSEIIPISKLPDEYERIIAQDIAFTKAIAAGEMTRYERGRRNRMARQLARTNEELTHGTEPLDQQKNLQEFVNDQLDQMLRVGPPIRLR
jgi:hypothetical protein